MKSSKLIKSKLNEIYLNVQPQSAVEDSKSLSLKCFIWLDAKESLVLQQPKYESQIYC